MNCLTVYLSFHSTFLFVVFHLRSSAFLSLICFSRNSWLWIPKLSTSLFCRISSRLDSCRRSCCLLYGISLVSSHSVLASWLPLIFSLVFWLVYDEFLFLCLLSHYVLVLAFSLSVLFSFIVSSLRRTRKCRRSHTWLDWWHWLETARKA